MADSDFIYGYYSPNEYELFCRSLSPLSVFDLEQDGFVLDGDSLLLFLLKQTRLVSRHAAEYGDIYVNRGRERDRERKEEGGIQEEVREILELQIDNNFGRPTLHILFAVRRYLKRIIDYNYRCQVVFFKDFEGVYNHPEYLFYRSVVMADLLSGDIDSLFVCKVFSSLNSAEFLKYLQDIEIIYLDLNLNNSFNIATMLMVNHGVSVGHLPSLKNPYTPVEIALSNKINIYFPDETTSPLFNVAKIPFHLPLSALIDKIVELYEENVDFQHIAVSHILSLCFQCIIPLSMRRVAYIPLTSNSSEDSIGFSIEQLNLLKEYRLRYFTLTRPIVERYLSVADNPLISSTDVSNSDFDVFSLFIGDLWDGRFLAGILLCHLNNRPTFVFSALPENYQSWLTSFRIPLFHLRIDPQLLTNFITNEVRPPRPPYILNAPIYQLFTAHIPLRRQIAFDSTNFCAIQPEVENHWFRLFQTDNFERRIRNDRYQSPDTVTRDEAELIHAAGDRFQAIRNIGYDIPPPQTSSFSHRIESTLGVDLNIREKLAASDIISQFDYLDIGPQMRDNFMLPNEPHPRHLEPWQLEMLFAISRNKSLLVLAPTSSGKTMSAEYAMRVVANSNDDGVGIFVLPTNALVFQQYSTLSSDPFIGRSLVAMFTSENRDNFDNGDYRILVTNPMCLQLLLFSRGHIEGSASLFQRLRYVVLDEIHCIGSSGAVEDSEGAVLERLLCMITCPVICLSATLSNTHQLLEWLRTIRQDIACTEVEVVDHSERSNALHFYSLGFKSDQLTPLHCRGLHHAGSTNLKVMFKGGGSTAITGDWILDLSQRPHNSISFKNFIEQQELVMYLSLYFDQPITLTDALNRDTSTIAGINPEQFQIEPSDPSKILFFPIRTKLISEDAFSGEDLITLKIENLIRGGDVRYSRDRQPFQLDFTQTKATISFQIKIQTATNQVEYELFYGNTMIDSAVITVSDDLDWRVALFTSGQLAISMKGKPYHVGNFNGSHLSNGSRSIPSVFSDPNAIPVTEITDINPLCFLSEINFSSPEILSNFFTSCPPSQPAHLLAVFDSLKSNLQTLRFSELLNKPETYVIPVELIELFGSIQLDEIPIHDLQRYCAFRSHFSSILQRMHNIIIAQKSLIDRLLLDSIFSDIFARIDLDWYGGLFFETPQQLSETSLSVLDGIVWEDEVDKVWTKWLTQDSSPILLMLRKCSLPLVFYPEVTSRSIFAFDRALKYFLEMSLLLGTDTEEITHIPSTLRRSIVDSLLSANAERLESLTTFAPSHDKYDIDKAEFISVLKDFMLREESLGQNFVESPTLIFHFNQKGIDTMLQYALECSDEWFGSEPNRFLSDKDLRKIKALSYVSYNEKEALKYGIGIHRRMSKRTQGYLRLVESLFQARKLKYVIATGSLSYGINMPAANVIFMGASCYNNGLMFRQCAGRAGRRGFGSNIGKVYFMGYSLRSIIRKLCTPLDRLRPQLSISSAYLLNSTGAIATAYDNDREWVQQMVYRTLAYPLYQYLIPSLRGRQLFDQSMIHSCLFSWSFFQQRGYLKGDGTPTLKSNLSHRLHYIEPACFYLTEFLTSCLDDTYAFSTKTLLNLIETRHLQGNDEDLEVKILCLLDYLLSQSAVRKNSAATYRLDSIVLDIWNDYNKLVMSSFVDYMKSVGNRVEESTLPLGSHKCTVVDTSSVSVAPVMNWFVANTLRPSLVPCARSHFSALSGKGDQFLSMTELVFNVKEGVFVSEKVLPAADPHVLMHKRIEEVYRTGSFKSLKYWDSYAETSCEEFSRHLRFVKAFCQLLINEVLSNQNIRRTISTQRLVKVEYLYKLIIRVINQYESQLRAAGREQYV